MESASLIAEQENTSIEVWLRNTGCQQHRVYVEWWSRHSLYENQKIALCLAHKASVVIIQRNIMLLTKDHFVELINQSGVFPYVIAPFDHILHAQEQGCVFGTFTMHRERRDEVYNVSHYADGNKEIVLTGNDIGHAKRTVV